MFRCHVCSSLESRRDYVKEMFLVDDKPVLVEHIPTTVCVRCGEETFSRETVERVRQMVHGETSPMKSIEMDVFAFA